MENISGYDRWKAIPPEEPEPVTHCVQCGESICERGAPCTIDGGMCEDCLGCNELGYGAPGMALLKRKRQAYEEAEREDRKDGKYNGCDYPGEGKDILQL